MEDYGKVAAAGGALAAASVMTYASVQAHKAYQKKAKSNEEEEEEEEEKGKRQREESWVAIAGDEGPGLVPSIML